MKGVEIGSSATSFSLNAGKKEALLSILTSSAHSLRADDISRKLRAQNIKEPLYKTIEALRLLQAQGLVEFRAGKWDCLLPQTAKSVEIKIPSYRTSPKISDVDQSKTPQQETALRGTQAEALEAKDACDWNFFRRLCGYYIDCLENDSGASIRLFDNELPERACFFGGQTFSWPRSQMRWDGSLATMSGISQFLLKLTKQATDEQCVIGYPIYVKKDTDSSGVAMFRYYPIFTIVVKPRIATGRIAISTDEVRFEVNSTWLSDKFDAEERRTFLSYCGLYSRDPDDDIEDVVDREVNTLSFESLGKVLESFFKEEVRETLSPVLVKNEQEWRAKKQGIYNRAGLFFGKRSRFTKTLLRELTVIGKMPDEELEKTALRQVFLSASAAKTAPQPSNEISKVLDLIDLNEEQFAAADSILTKPLTTISGPPGTGKSQVVSVAAMSARFNDQSILFACRNHKPIDAVVERLNALAPLGERLIVRSNPKKELGLKRFRFTEAISEIQAQTFEPRFREKWSLFQHGISELLKHRANAWKDVDALLTLEDRIAEIEGQKSALLQRWEGLPFKELSLRPKMVPKLLGLLYLKNFALERHYKNNKAFYNLPLKVGNQVSKRVNAILLNFKLKLVPELKIAIGSIYDFSAEQRIRAAVEFRALCVTARPLERQIAKLVKNANREARLEAYRGYAKAIKQQSQDGVSLEFKRRIGLLADQSRESLDALKSALRLAKNGMANDSQKATADNALVNNAPLILSHFPAWAVTTGSVGSSLPRIPGLFDVAIIDEASQCSIPDAIPVLFRAKRAAVVGDPKQLGCITHLSAAQDLAFRAKNGLNNIISQQRFGYSEKSFYDLCASSDATNPALLKKCYRSFFDIGEYCNQAFYNGDLETHTDESKLIVPTGRKPGIEWHDVKGNVVSASKSGSHCLEEREAILEILRNILVKNDFVGSVGVVTPFREQALKIEDLLSERLPSEVRERAKLLVATVDTFQGGEKDLMIFSLCLGPDMPAGSENFIRKDARRFNVAVSRARAVLLVVGNQEYAASSGVPHIESLAKGDWEKRFKHGPMETSWAPHESPWEQILHNALKAEGIETEPQHRVLGRRLDLALRDLSRGKKIDIEVDGAAYHLNADGTRKRDDLYRDLQLRASGWKVLRFWVYELRKDLKGCVSKIKQEWEG